MNQQQRKDLLLGRPPPKAGITWKNTEAVRCPAAHNRMSHQSCFLLIKKPLLYEVQSVSHVFEDFIEELRTRCLPCTQTPSALLAWEPRSLRNQTFKIRFTTPSAFCGGVDANGDTWVDRRTQTYCTTLMSFLILLSRANQHLCFCTLNVFTLILSPSQCHLNCGLLSALLLRAPVCVDRGINGANKPVRPHTCTHAPQTARPSPNRSLSCF